MDVKVVNAKIYALKLSKSTNASMENVKQNGGKFIVDLIRGKTINESREFP